MNIKFIKILLNFRLAAGWTVRGSNPGVGRGVETRFSAPVQTVPEAHTASYTMCTGSSLGVKRPRRGFDHPPTPFSADVKERVELYLYFPSGPFWSALGWNLLLKFC
jgi:hypothetical protein